METTKAILIDDEELARQLIRNYLKDFPGIEIIGECENGFEGVKAIADLKPDLIFLDIQMPKATGIEVTRWAKSNVEGVGILILTAYNDDPYVMAVLQAGANGFVLKTADPIDIILAVRDVYAGKSVLDPTVTGALMAQMFSKHGVQSVKDLTDREMEVLQLAARGYTNKAIGVQLGISDRTVQGHLAHVFDKLQASSRTEAVMRAVSLGWISQDVGTISEE
jgi:DNA-binding NarL/FixJ family response regulator